MSKFKKDDRIKLINPKAFPQKFKRGQIYGTVIGYTRTEGVVRILMDDVDTPSIVDESFIEITDVPNDRTRRLRKRLDRQERAEVIPRELLAKAVLEVLRDAYQGGSLLLILEKLIGKNMFPEEAAVKAVIKYLQQQRLIITDEYHECIACRRQSAHYRITDAGRERLHNNTFDLDDSVVDQDEPGVTAYND